MKEILEFIIENKAVLFGLLLAVLELFSRLLPTKADWSMINQIVLFLDKLIPNRTMSDGKPMPYERPAKRIRLFRKREA